METGAVSAICSRELKYGNYVQCALPESCGCACHTAYRSYQLSRLERHIYRMPFNSMAFAKPSAAAMPLKMAHAHTYANALSVAPISGAHFPAEVKMCVNKTAFNERVRRELRDNELAAAF